MNYIIIIGLFLTAQITAQSLPLFQYGGKTLQVVEQIKLTSPVVHDDPITASDDAWIQLFKNYFHPTSLESYQTFYLPQDWFGLSLPQFNDWQTRISIKKLHLQQILRLKDQQHQEFLVFQYAMESESYTVLQSTEFKLTAFGWKHTSQQNDAVADFLGRIGSLQINYYEAKALVNNTIQLDVLQPDQQRTFVEKFDRAALFPKIEMMLREKGVSQADIDNARTLFILKDDMGFVEHISSHYRFDDIDFSDMVNSAIGIQIYRSSRVQQD